MKTVKAWAIQYDTGRIFDVRGISQALYRNKARAKDVANPVFGDKVIRVEIRELKPKRK